MVLISSQITILDEATYRGFLDRYFHHLRQAPSPCIQNLIYIAIQRLSIRSEYNEQGDANKWLFIVA